MEYVKYKDTTQSDTTLSPMTSFCEKLKDWITLCEQWLSHPADGVQLRQWIESATELADSYEFTDAEEQYVERILEYYEVQFHTRLERPSDTSPSQPPLAYLDGLLQRKQTEQRSPEWYRQMSEIISASELGQLFASPRQRAKLVTSKTAPPPPRNQALAVYSDSMSAFDWGIRFEPVVKQLYEEMYGVTVKELGRLHHPENPKCTASPDGLVYHCPRGIKTGRLIEIKCPVTREIDGTIPKDYYTQMQMQLHVTGLNQCDYIEAEFASPYQQMCQKEGPTLYSGFIALVFHSEAPSYFEYRYSPVNAGADWLPTLREAEEVVEQIPWRLMKWSEHIVVRNEEWWTSLQPMLQTFWEDVERAKRGEFLIPDSTRPSKKPKVDACRIQFSSPFMICVNKLDEKGQEQGPGQEQGQDPLSISYLPCKSLEQAPDEVPSSYQASTACIDSSIGDSSLAWTAGHQSPSHNMTDS